MNINISFPALIGFCKLTGVFIIFVGMVVFLAQVIPVIGEFLEQRFSPVEIGEIFFAAAGLGVISVLYRIFK